VAVQVAERGAETALAEAPTVAMAASAAATGLIVVMVSLHLSSSLLQEVERYIAICRDTLAQVVPFDQRERA
jgi:hypothetical protein